MRHIGSPGIRANAVHESKRGNFPTPFIAVKRGSNTSKENKKNSSKYKRRAWQGRYASKNRARNGSSALY